MDNKKFEALIDLIINENEEQARAMFHDIVVEKSREIYESIMDEEFGGQDQVGGLMDEISAEEEGMTEEEDEFADIGDEGDEEVELGSDELGGEETGEENIEDRVVDLEDKLDELMAEFEQLMGSEGGDMGGEESGDDFGGDMGGDEMMEGEEEDLEESSEEDEEESLEESVQLQKVSVAKMGDNGQNTKSIVSSGPKVGGNGASAANLNKGFVDSGKGGTQGGLLNPTTKDLKGAGQFKNAPGNKNVDPSAAPKPKHGDDGVNTKSIVGESRKTTKRIVK